MPWKDLEKVPLMVQEPLWFEDIYDALRHVVRASGGPKRVGSAIYPEKSAAKAAETLLACLNRDRAEKLDPEQVLLVLRIGREHGCHVAMHHMAEQCGYADPVPVEPRDVEAEIGRHIDQQLEQLNTLMARLERLRGSDEPVKAIHGGR